MSRIFLMKMATQMTKPITEAQIRGELQFPNVLHQSTLRWTGPFDLPACDSSFVGKLDVATCLICANLCTDVRRKASDTSDFQTTSSASGCARRKRSNAGMNC